MHSFLEKFLSEELIKNLLLDNQRLSARKNGLFLIGCYSVQEVWLAR